MTYLLDLLLLPLELLDLLLPQSNAARVVRTLAWVVAWVGAVLLTLTWLHVHYTLVLPG